jgi:hypothetical protein
MRLGLVIKIPAWASRKPNQISAQLPGASLWPSPTWLLLIFRVIVDHLLAQECAGGSDRVTSLGVVGIKDADDGGINLLQMGPDASGL